jgi:predicted DNA-binding ribbon-helix-helix protein
MSLSTAYMTAADDKNLQTGDKKKPRREKTTLISHNIMIQDRRTSVRLEKEMWMAVKEIARREKCTVHALCTAVSQRKRPDTSLTAAIRVFIMAYYQAAATDDGHRKAGHGLGASAASSILTSHAQTPYYGLREFKSFEFKSF